MSDRFDHTLEHTFDTKPDGGGDNAVAPMRRIELITGAGRRRQWRQDDKARIIVESLRPGANVSEVARRNGLSPQQLFGWRREARELLAEKADAPSPPASEPARPSALRTTIGGSRSLAGARTSADAVPAFASVVIAATTPPSPPSPPPPPASGHIEIVLRDVTVRVIGQVEPAALTAVLRALRRAT